MIRFLKGLLFAILLLVGFNESVLAQFASQATYAGVSTGTSNAQVLTIPNVLSFSDLVGVQITWLPGTGLTNTGPTQINVSGLGLKNLFKPSPGGPVALSGGELVATSSPAQVAMAQWDGTEFVLISNLNATTSFLVITPQGYLTPCQISSGSPVAGCSVGNVVPTGDVVSATTLYYEPDSGSEVPIWNGSQFVPFQVTEPQMTLILGSANLANTIYDVCAAIEAGVPTLVTSVAWTTSTAGGGARGTGAGTAQIDKTVGGLWTNSVQITGKNGANSYTIAAHQCTIVASIFIDGTNGQVSFYRTFGQSRKWSVSNAYNRKPLYLKAGDSTATWTGNASFGPAHGNSANSLTVFSGFAEESYDLKYTTQGSFTVGATSTVSLSSGVGFNSTTVASGVSGKTGGGTSSTTLSLFTVSPSEYLAPPSLGINVITALEVGASFIVVGTENGSVLSAQWRG